MLYNGSMKTSTRREQVLARSRAADAARLEALKESDGMATYTPPEDEETVAEPVEQDETSEVTDLEDEGGE